MSLIISLIIINLPPVNRYITMIIFFSFFFIITIIIFNYYFIILLQLTD